MPTITLTSVFIQNSLDLTTALQLQTSSVLETPQVAGSVRAYANGRQRVVSSSSKPRTVALTFTLVSPSDATTLASWAGQLVLVRDPFGLKMWGAFFQTPRTQQIAPNVNDVAVTFTEVTHTEAV